MGGASVELEVTRRALGRSSRRTQLQVSRSLVVPARGGAPAVRLEEDVEALRAFLKLEARGAMGAASSPRGAPGAAGGEYEDEWEASDRARAVALVRSWFRARARGGVCSVLALRECAHAERMDELLHGLDALGDEEVLTWTHVHTLLEQPGAGDAMQRARRASASFSPEFLFLLRGLFDACSDAQPAGAQGQPKLVRASEFALLANTSEAFAAFARHALELGPLPGGAAARQQQHQQQDSGELLVDLEGLLALVLERAAHRLEHGALAGALRERRHAHALSTAAKSQRAQRGGVRGDLRDVLERLDEYGTGLVSLDAARAALRAQGVSAGQLQGLEAFTDSQRRMRLYVALNLHLQAPLGPTRLSHAAAEQALQRLLKSQLPTPTLRALGQPMSRALVLRHLAATRAVSPDEARALARQCEAFPGGPVTLPLVPP